jgi:hypothetical protein
MFRLPMQVWKDIAKDNHPINVYQANHCTMVFASLCEQTQVDLGKHLWWKSRDSAECQLSKLATQAPSSHCSHEGMAARGFERLGEF